MNKGAALFGTYVECFVVPQHGPGLLNTKLEGPSNTKLNFISTVQPLDDIQGPLEIHGHKSWSVSKGHFTHKGRGP